MKRIPNEPTPSRVPDEMVLAQNAAEMTAQAPKRDGGGMTGEEFIALELPPIKPLLGTEDDCYIAEGRGAVLLASEPHQGKTVMMVDLVAHLASGTEWLGLPVERPVRVLIIENEGPMAMFQRQLKQKSETWEGESFLQNVHILTADWGNWTLRDERDRHFIRHYAEEHAIDIVVGDTLGTLGTIGNGTPAETTAFQEQIAEAGHGRQAWLLLHHFNRSDATGLSLRRLSGVWDRWPDTVGYLEKDGFTTKLGWAKDRWVSNKKGWMILKQIVETKSFALTERAVASEDRIKADVLTYIVHTHGDGPTTSDVRGEVEGKNAAKDAALKELVDEGKIENRGKANHQRWFGTDTSTPDADELSQLALDQMP